MPKYLVFKELPDWESIKWEYNEKNDLASWLPPKKIDEKTVTMLANLPSFAKMNSEGYVIIENASKYGGQIFVPQRMHRANTRLELPLSAKIKPAESSSSEAPKVFQRLFEHKKKRSNSIGSQTTSPFAVMKDETSSNGFSYPASLLLDALINENYNAGCRGSTVAYRELKDKQKKDAKMARTQVIQAEVSLKHASLFPEIKLKVAILERIAEILALIDIEYQGYSKGISNKARKEITDYFCRAIVSTMTSGQMRLNAWDNLLILNNSDNALTDEVKGFQSILLASKYHEKIMLQIGQLREEVELIVELESRKNEIWENKQSNLAKNFKTLNSFLKEEIFLKFKKKPIKENLVDTFVKKLNEQLIDTLSNVELCKLYPNLISTITSFDSNLYIDINFLDKIASRVKEKLELTGLTEESCDELVEQISPKIYKILRENLNKSFKEANKKSSPKLEPKSPRHREPTASSSNSGDVPPSPRFK